MGTAGRHFFREISPVMDSFILRYPLSTQLPRELNAAVGILSGIDGVVNWNFLLFKLLKDFLFDIFICFVYTYRRRKLVHSINIISVSYFRKLLLMP